MNELILFDFDGTIADTWPVVKEIIPEISKKYKVEIPSEREIEELRNYGVREVIRRLGIPRWKVPFLARDIRRLQRERVMEAKIFPGIAKVINRLKREGFIVVVISSNSTENVNNFLNQNKLKVDYISGDVSLFGKTKMIKRAMKSFGVDKNNTWYIGDEVRDIEASKKAGVKCIAVSWGLNTSSRLSESRPDYLIKRPLEIFTVLSNV